MIRELVSKVADQSEPVKNEVQGIQKFGRFFTGYIGTASLAVAALPIPVRLLHLIPAFASQKKFMSTYTSMSCFLVFAYVFYCRHTLARWMFARRGQHFAVRFWVSVLPPLLFICCSAGARLPSSALLSKIDAREIPGSGRLIVLYLGMVVFAESAFVVMAIREYLQDALKLEERELIFGVDPKKLGTRQVS
jgi:hypothetical protein